MAEKEKTIWAKKKGEEKKVVLEPKEPLQASGKVLQLIDEVGGLRAELSQLRKRYDASREKVRKAIKKFGDDVPVYGTNYWVINSHDDQDVVDVIDVLERFQSAKIRRQVLSVILKELRAVIGKDKELEKAMIETVQNKETTLHVNAIERGGK